MGIAIGVLAAIAAFLGFAASRPGEFRIQRSATFHAPPERIFEKLNDFREWAKWSPWEKLDPQLKRTHSGATTGKGAIYEWEGNKKVGQGRMEITESSSPNRLAIKLDFLKPFEAHNTTEFSLRPNGTETDVTWAMTGVRPFSHKVMSLAMNMDKLVGTDFEKGLANLKSVVES